MKRFISLIAIIFTILSVATTVSAEEITPVSSEEGLRQALVSGSTDVRLEGDIELNSKLSIVNPVSIDLGGHTISMGENFAKSGYDVDNTLIHVLSNGVTIKNGSIVAGSNNNHAVNVWGDYDKANGTLSGVVLSNLAIDHSKAYRGAPLVVCNAEVTLDGSMSFVTGSGSWYAVNVDPKTGSASLLGGSNLSVSYSGDKVLLKVDNATANVSVSSFAEKAGLESFTNGKETYYDSSDRISDFCVAKVGEKGFTSLALAIAEAEKTGAKEIDLLQSVTEDDISFKTPGTYVLDLNGYTLRSDKINGDIIALRTPNLTLTIKNGTLLSEEVSTDGIYAYNKGGLDTSGDYKNLNLPLDGVKINTKDQSVGVQGLNSNQNVTIKNSEITCGNTAVYFPPKSGILTIENSKITGVDNGLVIKGGTVDIKGSSTLIEATGEGKDQDKPYDGNIFGEGFPKTGSAIYVEGNYSSVNGAPRPIALNISDGTIKSTHGAAVAMNFVRDAEAQKTKIYSGSFSSDVKQFVVDDFSMAKLSTSSNSMYYVDDEGDLRAKLSKLANKGDQIEVMKGDLNLEIAEGITVLNSGEGKVTVNGETVTDEPIVSHVHKWGPETWTWSDDMSYATLKLTCTDDPSHVYITKVLASLIDSMDPTCTEDGYKLYSASLAMNDALYEDEKKITIPSLGHNVEHIAAKEATFTEKGNIEYWHCLVCDKYFSDEELTKEITYEDTVIDLIEDAEEIIESANKQELLQLINEYSALNKGNYTDDSWAKMQNALAKASTLYKDPTVSQSDVDQMVKDLLAARNNLVKIKIEAVNTGVDYFDWFKVSTGIIGTILAIAVLGLIFAKDEEYI